MEEDLKMWTLTIRQLVLEAKLPLTTHEVNRKVKLLRGQDIPYRKFQCKSLEVMINQIPGMIVYQERDKYYVLSEAPRSNVGVRESSKISSLEKTLKSVQQSYTKTKSNSSDFIDENEDKNVKPTTVTSGKSNNLQTQNDTSKNSGINKENNVEPVAEINDEKSNKLQVLDSITKSSDTANGSNYFNSKNDYMTKQPSDTSMVKSDSRRKHVEPSESVPAVSTSNYLNNSYFLSQKKIQCIPSLIPSNQNVQTFSSSLKPNQNISGSPIPLLQNQSSSQDVLNLTSIQQRLLKITQGTQRNCNATPTNVTTVEQTQRSNLTSNDPRLHLLCYTKARNIPAPQYKHLSALNTIFAVVAVQSKKYSSYPSSANSREEAEKIAASIALENLLE